MTSQTIEHTGDNQSKNLPKIFLNIPAAFVRFKTGIVTTAKLY